MAGLAVAACLLAGCSTTALAPSAPRGAAAAAEADARARAWRDELGRGLAAIPAHKRSGDARVTAFEGLSLLRDGRLEDASRALNTALRLDPGNSPLQMFNALAYQEMAQDGEASKLELAEQGYLLAIQFDPSNWSAHYLLGMLYFQQRRFALAQKHLAEVLLFVGEDQEVLFRLMAASYYARDPVTAAACLDRLRVTRPNDPELLRLSALVSAALDDRERTRQWLHDYAATRPSADDYRQTEQRVRQWQSRFDSSPAPRPPERVLTQASGFPFGSSSSGSSTPFGSASSSSGGFGSAPSGSGGFGSSSSGSPSPFGSSSGSSSGFGSSSGSSSGFGSSSGGFGSGSPFGGGQSQGAGGMGMPGPDARRMVLVDVVLMRTEDALRTHKGVNLLNALTLQFSRQRSRSSSTNTSESGSLGEAIVSTTTAASLTRAINIPMLTYSLNIVNSNSNLNEVLARPTLAALEGVQSQFFSGTTLNAAVVSTNAQGGSAVQIEKEIGVKLSVIPAFLPDGRIRLSIDAQRTFLKPPSTDVDFTYKLETTKIMVNAHVVMNYGETLVLGGLSEKETNNSRDGVPLLQDLPGVQYLFSSRDTSNFQRSVLMLITPRPPQFTFRNDETPGAARPGGAPPDAASAAADAAAEDDSMRELRARYGDWFRPYPNLSSVFNHLNNSTLYREFRTGDVSLEKWDRQNSRGERLRQALEFLFY